MEEVWANTTPEVPMVVNALPSLTTPVPTAAGCIVAGAADNHSSLAQSQGVCHLTGQLAGHFAGFIDLAQQCLVDLEQVQQFV